MLAIIGEDHVMTERHQQTLVALARPTAASTDAGLDGLHQVPVHLVPEIRLHLADDAILVWARMEAEAGMTLPAPFWASAWLGGQALARYIIDHPETVAGRRVLDFASGSGLVGIAASLAGASEVIANDIDPYAIAAIEMNARVNAVTIAVSCDNLLDGDDADTDGVDVILAGDVFYSESMARAVLPFLERASARGADVLIGDPGRVALPGGRLRIVATYPAANAGTLADAELEQIHVLRLAASTRD
jgi:predicted nicotinamide N-methyase